MLHYCTVLISGFGKYHCLIVIYTGVRIIHDIQLRSLYKLCWSIWIWTYDGFYFAIEYTTLGRQATQIKGCHTKVIVAPAWDPAQTSGRLCWGHREGKSKTRHRSLILSGAGFAGRKQQAAPRRSGEHARSRRVNFKEWVELSCQNKSCQASRDNIHLLVKALWNNGL